MNAEDIRARVHAGFVGTAIASAAPEEIRSSLVESASAVGAQAADILYLMIADCPDPGQQAFTRMLEAAREAALTLLEAFFAEFGQAHHPDLNTAKARARDGYQERLRTLGALDATGGTA